MSLVVDVLSWACLLAGGFLVIVTGISLLRLPDFFSRIHGVSVTDTLGAGLILLGLALQAGFSLVAVKLAFVLILLVITSPPTAHALAKAALLHGLDPQLDGEEDDHRRTD